MDLEAMIKSITPMFINNYPDYQRIAQRFYQDYLCCQEEYSSLLDKYGQFDVLSHTPEEQIRYQQLVGEKQTYCMTSLVFEAFACEAYINFICERIFGKEYFEKMEKDKLKLPYRTSRTNGKLKYFCEKNPIGELYIDSEIRKQVETLLEVRNDLAHNKTREVRLEMEPEEFLYALWNVGVKAGNVYSVLKSSIGICQKLIDEITKAYKQKTGAGESKH